MMNNKSKEQIISSIHNILSEFEESTKQYLNGFDIDSAFSFSDDEEIRKKHLRAYNKFSATLKKNIEKCELETAHLSALIFKADNARDKELAESLVKHFDRYIQFSLSVSGFIKSAEKILLNKESRFRPSSIASLTRELLAAIQNYKENI